MKKTDAKLSSPLKVFRQLIGIFAQYLTNWRSKKFTHETQVATYFFVEQVVVVGDVVAEQVGLRSDNQSVWLCARLEPAGGEAAYHLVNVE